MKANRFFPHPLSVAVLAALLLSATSLRAQTFGGAKALSDLPSVLEFAVYPLSNTQSTIQVNINNRPGDLVRITIRDEKGSEFYEEFTSIGLYRRRFDLSTLPLGHYRVDLSKASEQFAQVFLIDASETGHIVMENLPFRFAPDKTTKITGARLVIK